VYALCKEDSMSAGRWKEGRTHQWI